MVLALSLLGTPVLADHRGKGEVVVTPTMAPAAMLAHAEVQRRGFCINPC